MVVIARYIRVSRKEQRKGLDRQLFKLEKCVQDLGGDPSSSPLWVDVKSGGDRNRKEFQSMVQAVENKKIDILIAYRVDRLARDAEYGINLGRLFEVNKVKLYDYQKSEFVDFSNPDQWENYAHQAVSAEAEIRKLSKRIRDGYEYNRVMGKAGSKPCWGYIRNSQTEKYELDPKFAEAVRGSIEIVLETGNFQLSCRLIAERWGKQWKPNTLRVWISNPCLRGHTGYKLQNKHWAEIKYNTHPDQAVMSEEEFKELQNIIAGRRLFWKSDRQNPRHPLGGLAYCARCGTKMCVTRGGNIKNPKEDRPLYFSCRDRVQKIKPDNVCTMNRSLYLPALEDLVAEELAKYSERLATIAQTSSSPKKDPQILALENLLAGLNQLGDNPALESSKSQLKAQIALLEAKSNTSIEDGDGDKELLISVFSDPAVFKTLQLEEKRAVFVRLIEQITIDVEEVFTGEISRRNRPKQQACWLIQIHLKPWLLQEQVETVRFSYGWKSSRRKPENSH